MVICAAAHRLGQLICVENSIRELSRNFADLVLDIVGYGGRQNNSVNLELSAQFVVICDESL